VDSLKGLAPEEYEHFFAFLRHQRWTQLEYARARGDAGGGKTGYQRANAL